MNRRGFLGLLGASALAPLVAVPALDLGRKIFLPPRGGWPLTYSLDDFCRRYLEPAMRQMAQKIDEDLLAALRGCGVTGPVTFETIKLGDASPLRTARGWIVTDVYAPSHRQPQATVGK